VTCHNVDWTVTDRTAEAKVDESLDRLIDLGLASKQDLRPATTEELDAAERRYGPLPSAYRRFVERAGRGAGRLLAGTDTNLWWLLRIRDELSNTKAADGSPLIQPSDIVVGSHQGYILIVLVGSGDDPQVAEFKEGESAPRIVAPSFTEWLAESIESDAAAWRHRNQYEREHGVLHPRPDVTIYPATAPIGFVARLRASIRGRSSRDITRR